MRQKKRLRCPKLAVSEGLFALFHVDELEIKWSRIRYECARNSEHIISDTTSVCIPCTCARRFTLAESRWLYHQHSAYAGSDVVFASWERKRKPRKREM
jgi:hypothetical protein